MKKLKIKKIRFKKNNKIKKLLHLKIRTNNIQSNIPKYSKNAFIWRYDLLQIFSFE